ncbi:MAG: hypothetical protein ACRDCT_07480, partial [Shewanella sp.]
DSDGVLDSCWVDTEVGQVIVDTLEHQVQRMAVQELEGNYQALGQSLVADNLDWVVMLEELLLQ